MKNALLVITGAFALLLISFLSPTSVHSSYSRSKPGLHPIKGKILVSFKQDRSDADYFTWNGKKVNSRLSSYALKTLESYGLKRCRKAYQRNSRAIYSLDFKNNVDDNIVIQYLKSLSNIEFVQQDYYPEFCLEPNDFYYQPDSEDSTKHWVPYDYNIIYGNYGDLRQCETQVISGVYPYEHCCTPSDYIFPCYSYRDSLFFNDQWYLQFVQADKAWDIEYGDPDVKVMVMDSGIDFTHPDLDGNIWNNNDDQLGDMNGDGLPGSSGDDDHDLYYNYNDPEIRSGDIDGDGIPLYGDDAICDAGQDGDYGFGPNGIDDDPPGPGGGDDDTLMVGSGNDPWDDNVRGPSSQNPDSSFNDDLDEIPFLRFDDDENGYPDDYYGFNFYNPVQDWPNIWEASDSDGLPGLKGWIVDYYDSNDGIHFDDYNVKTSDFDGDGMALFGTDRICDAGDDGDYGFGQNAIDDDPPGPGGGDDDTLIAGSGNDPWDDNRRGPGSQYADSLPYFDDDMDDVYYMRFDNEEDGNPLSLPRDDGCPKATANHGTNMAGIIGSETNNTIGTAGFAWYCSLVAAKIAIGYPEKAYEEWASDYDTTKKDGVIIPMIKAFDYAIDQEVDIINMSLTFPEDTVRFPLVNRAIERAYDYGVIMLASAGNDHRELEGYPAAHPNVISVTGTNRFDKGASYTAYDDYVDLCAPVGERANADGGEAYSINTSGCSTPGPRIYDRGADCIVTAYYQPPSPLMGWTDPGLPHGYATSGLATSGACAQASGLAALLVSFYPRSSFSGSASDYVDFIKGEMKRGCVELDDPLYTAGKLGAGRINAYRSLTQWGDTDGSKTWSGDIYVSTNYVILSEDTLTISPGTTVYFMPDNNDSIGSETATNALLVRGHLQAVGTSGSPITFRAFGDNAQAGYWKGIRALGNNSSMNLRHCVIQDAEYGIMSDRTISMRDCEIKNCAVTGVYLWEDSTTVNESTVDKCTISYNDSTDAVGMRIWYCTDVVVDSCDVENNYRGIWISDCSPEISHTHVEDNYEVGVFITDYHFVAGIPNPDLSWDLVKDNGEEGMYISYSEGYYSFSRIDGNDSYGLYIAGFDSAPTVRKCKVVNHSTGIRVASGVPVLGDTLDGAELGGKNTFDNTVYNIYRNATLAPPESLMAINNYWGTSFPNTDKIKGKVIWSPALSSDPIIYLARNSGEGTITSLRLFQNYPNPLVSGGMTTIKFSLPRAENVTIRVYDVSGRRIKTLTNGVRHPGHHFVTWDGKNERGAQVAPGIYFYQMKCGDKIQSKKIVLLR